MAKKKTSKKAAAKPKASASGPKKTKARTSSGSKKPAKATSHKSARTPAAEKPSESLEALRRGIDRVDARLVKLLNERAELVVKVGEFKRGNNTPIYAPHREAEVLAKALERNTGPLPDRTIEGVYKELMSGSFMLEHPLRIGFLGPMGSYSHHASVTQFGSSVDFVDLRAIGGVFTEVRRGHVDYGIVPIENSTGGGIVETLDAFREHAEHLSVYAEVQIAIHHCLLANCEPSSVRRIHSKPEVFQQCRTWLATQFPNAELIPAPSSSKAAETAKQECDLAGTIGAEPGSAAVGSRLAGEIYGLKTQVEGIEDNPNNITRFLVLSREKARPSKDDKTSIMFKTDDRPGALVEVLKIFEDGGVNLTHIDKRPSGRVNWEYTFFVDAQGHREDREVAAVLEELSRRCREMVVLGSYPRSTRIL